MVGKKFLNKEIFLLIYLSIREIIEFAFFIEKKYFLKGVNLKHNVKKITFFD